MDRVCLIVAGVWLAGLVVTPTALVVKVAFDRVAWAIGAAL